MHVGVLKVLGWVFLPFIMIFVSWKKLNGVAKTFGIIWAVIVFIGVAGNLTNDDTSEPVAAPLAQTDKADKPKATKAPKETKAPVVLSKEGVSSDVNIVVNSFESKAEIGDNQFAIAKAQGVFKVIELTLTNGQKDAITIDTGSFTLIDDQKREFSSSSDAYLALSSSSDEKEGFFLTKLNPGLSITGYIAFDVPADAKGFTLQARGGVTGKKITLKVE